MSRRALIIGATGLVAPALSRKLTDLGWQTLHTARTGPRHINFDLAAPDLAALPKHVDAVFLVAAETSLRRCEEDPKASARINVLAPAEIARHYASAGTHVLTLSTSLVFDGESAFPDRLSKRNPPCIYGRQKADLEDILLGLPTPVTILRTTKIVESLSGLTSGWSRDLRQATPIHPFSDLLCAPVSLARIVDILAFCADRGVSGTYQHSGDLDIDYASIARALCRRIGAAETLMAPCRSADLPTPPVVMPRHSTLGEFLPAGFTPSGPENVSQVLATFLEHYDRT